MALEGPRAVGKSTLLAGITKVAPEIKLFPGFKNNSKYEMVEKKGFCDNQKEYIGRKICQYKLDSPEVISIITRGTENVEFFTRTYPVLLGKSEWQIQETLQTQIKMLQENRSDLIIYLDADDSVLCKRNRMDDRQRIWFARELGLWNILMRDWFRKYSYCQFVNTNELSPEMVLSAVLKILKE